MNTHLYTSTSFFENNILCPRCLSYVTIENVENHASSHEINRLDRLHSVFEEILPSSSDRMMGSLRLRTNLDSSFSRLARLQTLYNLENILFDNTQYTGRGEDSDDTEYMEDTLGNDGQGIQYELNMYIANLLGNVEVGVENIDKISTLINNTDIDQNVDCNICLDTIKQPRKLLCNHVFCDGCISTWLSKHKNCPVCRIDLEDAFKNMEKIDN